MKLSKSEIKFLEDEAAIAGDPEALLSLAHKATLCHQDNLEDPTLAIAVGNIKAAETNLEQLVAIIKKHPDVKEKVPKVKEIFEKTVTMTQSALITLSDRSMLNQDWYINPMKAAGYSLQEGGHCFGMSHMAMQAFLVDEEMTTFNERLHTIERGPI